MEKLSDIFELIDKKNYDSSNCFLCGDELTHENVSEEHVFPKWLQNKYNLWNQTITLLNGTTITYKQLKIPCCKKCNNDYLSPLEIEISQAVENGISNLKALGNLKLFLWAGKIYFGLMYKELFLQRNQKEPNGEKILDADYMETFKMLYIFLQEIRGKHKCIDFEPSSVFIFDLQEPNSIKQKWDYFDSHIKPFISFRMSNIGIIVALEDMKTLSEVMDISDFYKVALHPDQFKELISILYTGFLHFDRTPKFITVENKAENRLESYLLPLAGLNMKPLYKEWDDKTYKMVLSIMFGIPFENMIEYGKLNISWIHDEKGNIRYIPIN